MPVWLERSEQGGESWEMRQRRNWQGGWEDYERTFKGSDLYSE